VRFFVLSGHYRSPIDFSYEALDAAGKGWERLTAPAVVVRERLRSPGLPEGSDAGMLKAIEDARAAFVEAMDDDFNTPKAMAGLFDFNKIVNTLLNGDPPILRGTLDAIDSFYRETGGQVLGVIPERATTSASGDREAGLIRLLIELRAEARKRKDFATADSVRSRLTELGVTLEDGKDGTTWKV
jgi:cysteinyl-tRNA synthetase